MYWLGVLTGYFFAVLVGHVFVKWIVDKLWKEVRYREEENENARPAAYLSRLIGIIERALYVGAIQIGHAEFIGIWLALKVAGKWKRWKDGLKPIFNTPCLRGNRPVYGHKKYINEGNMV